MRKLQQLHDLLGQHVDSARIHSWAEDIKPDYQQDSLDDGFIVSYKANYLLSAISPSNSIIAHVVFYLAQFDQYNAKPIFNTDALNNNKVDVMLEIKLIEQANLTPSDDGVWLVAGKRYDLTFEGFTPEASDNNFVEFVNENN